VASHSPRSAAKLAADVTADAVIVGAAELGLDLDARQGEQLARYAALLQRWNAVHNLTAIENPADVLSHHLLDSLAIVPVLAPLTAGRAVRVLDVGAGGGLPGIPLAIAYPRAHVTLVDKVQKKVAFLTQAKLELGLTNIECVHARVETMRAEQFDLIVSRAFASLAEFVQLTRHLLAPGGWWCAMKGTLPQAELAVLADAMPGARVVGTAKLAVPRLDAERHLILLQAN
jgi:16S rRNA (guanine527-N7)-methyltransferase